MQLKKKLFRSLNRLVRTLSNLSLAGSAVVLLLAFILGLLIYLFVGSGVSNGIVLAISLATFTIVLLSFVKTMGMQSNHLEKLLSFWEEFSDFKNEYGNHRRQDRNFTKKLFDQYTHNIYREVEAYHNIDKLLDLKQPLPSMSGWAATPDLISEVISIIQGNSIKTVLDLGSGVSTIAAAYALQKTKGGRVISIDHDKEFLGLTISEVEKRGLSSLVDLRHAPLEAISVDDSDYQWYSKKPLKGVKNIDLLIVDGPPGGTGSLARYPALPLIYNSLSKDAIVIVDDYRRKDEREIVEQWISKYPEFKVREHKGLKGFAVLTRFE